MGEPKRVLWTGGFDSTFRICHLLFVEGCDVQPIYILADRPNAGRELETMTKMRTAIEARAQACLLPTEIHLASDYAVPSHLKALYDKIKTQAHVGTQYLWLASVAERRGWLGVELCMERYPGGASALQKLVFRNPPASELNGNAEAQLFRYWSFPILHLSKQEMKDIALEHGYLDILMMRWFCHVPIGPYACGICRPCTIARRDGMVEGVRFLPKIAQWTLSLGRALARTRARFRS